MSQQQGGAMGTASIPPHFNVNFYNQDENYNQDHNDVKDNGNLNKQLGNSHLTAHGNLQNLQPHTRFPQQVPFYPYPPQQPGQVQRYPPPVPTYPYFYPYTYFGYPRPSPFAKFPTRPRLQQQPTGPIWLQSTSIPANPPSLVPLLSQVSPNVSFQIEQQLQRTSIIIQKLLQSENLKEHEKDEETNFPPMVKKNQTQEILDELVELAKDPMYDPSNFPPTVKNNQTEEISDEFVELAEDPMYDPSAESLKNSSRIELTPSNSTLSRLSRTKRNDFEGN